MNKSSRFGISLVVPTQFGNVPDVAFEELKQLRAQQQQQTGLVPVPLTTFAVTNANPVNSSNTSSETLASLIRPSARDSTIAQANTLVRSRSLASNSTARPSVAASSTYLSNPAHQTPLFATNKQSFLTPTRFGVSRLLTGGIPVSNNTTTSHPPAPSSSSTSYASTRSLPISTAPNIKQRHTNNHPHHAPTVTINAPTTTAPASNDQQRHTYETTYRASFIKPLAP